MKLFRCVAAVIMTISLFACVPTPEKEIVIGKDQSSMIEAAKSDDFEITFPTELSFSSNRGIVSITADCDVITPNTIIVPMLKAKKTVFSQETVDRVLSTLWRNEPMLEQRSIMTKEEIASEIAFVLTVINDPEYEEYYDYYKNEYLPQLQEDYLSAPAEGSDIVSDGKLKLQDIQDPTSRKIIGTKEGLWLGTSNQALIIQNGLNLVQPIVDEKGDVIPFDNQVYLVFYRTSGKSLSIGQEEILINESDYYQSVSSRDMQIKPIDAITMADSLIYDLNIPFDVDSISLVSASFEDDNSKVQSSAYCIHLRRIIDGIPCSNQDTYIDSSRSESFEDPWNPENLTVWINDDGIIRFEWRNPYSATDTLIASCSLLPLGKIQDRIESILFVNNQAKNVENPLIEQIDLQINKIELCLYCVRQQNSNDCLYIPVWICTGCKCYRLTDESFKVKYPDRYGVLCVVNAIDGSTIDPNKGY